MQGQNLAQVQVQEASEDDGTTSFSNIFVRIFGGLLRKWKEASKKSQFVAEVQSDDRDVVVLEGDTGRQAMPDEDSNLGTNAQSR